MKTGHDAAALAEHLDRLVPEPPLGILVIARGGERVVAVLGDQEHAVHGERPVPSVRASAMLGS